MSKFPRAIQKPITAPKGRKRMAVYNRVNLHVAVSEAASLHGYFNQSGIPDSHFYVRRDGTIEQYVDTAYNAFADLQGNDATISIETQGDASGKWTKAQLKALAELYAWAIETHGIRVGLARDSKLGASSKGLSWHRLGVNGNFPRTGILRGRAQRGGGMQYSTSYGKTCPGDAKIKQIPGILKAAVKLGVSGGKGTSVPKPKPKPKPKRKPKHKKIKTDGWFGTGTIRRTQEVAGTTRDGKVSGQPLVNKRKNPGLTTGWQWINSYTPTGSNLIRDLQRRLRAKGLYRGKIDGWAGPKFWTAFQQALGTPVDGMVSKKSLAVKQFQKNLNKGKLF